MTFLRSHTGGQRARAKTLPASEFYWAVLDGSGLDRGWTRRRRLGYLFESFLPVSIDQVHATYVRLPQPRHRMLACGMRRERVAAIVAEGHTSLHPDAIPSVLDAGPGARPSDIDLLHGEFLAAPLRRLQQRRRIVERIVIGAWTAIVVIAMQRHAAHAREETSRIERAIAARCDEAGIDTHGPLPPELLLETRIRSLEQARSAKSESGSDAAETLATILSHLPRPTGLEIDSIRVEPDGVILEFSVIELGHVTDITRGLSRCSDYAVGQPEVSASRDSNRVVLRLSRSETAS